MDVYNKCLKFFEIQSQEPDVERVSNVSGNSFGLPWPHFLSTESRLNSTLIVKSLSVGDGSYR